MNLQNAAFLITAIILAVELYFMSASAQHRKKRLHKGWQRSTGVIDSMSSREDHDTQLKKTVTELVIIAENGARVYAKVSPHFNIYEIGEEVELEVKNGYHRMLGNDRVGSRGRKELILGTVPMLIIIGIAAVLSIVF